VLVEAKDLRRLLDKVKVDTASTTPATVTLETDRFLNK
jgi:hypothetical protein